MIPGGVSIVAHEATWEATIMLEGRGEDDHIEATIVKTEHNWMVVAFGERVVKRNRVSLVIAANYNTTQ